MTSQRDKVKRFLELHHGNGPLLIPNPWDAGSARLLEWLGFPALATTSSGFAATLGRPDGSASREQALGHAAAIAAATTLPVSADLEDGFSGSPEGVVILRTLSRSMVRCAGPVPQRIPGPVLAWTSSLPWIPRGGDGVPPFRMPCGRRSATVGCARVTACPPAVLLPAILASPAAQSWKLTSS